MLLSMRYFAGADVRKCAVHAGFYLIANLKCGPCTNTLKLTLDLNLAIPPAQPQGIRMNQAPHVYTFFLGQGHRPHSSARSLIGLICDHRADCALLECAGMETDEADDAYRAGSFVL
jgi:hypothetical protein